MFAEGVCQLYKVRRAPARDSNGKPEPRETRGRPEERGRPLINSTPAEQIIT